MSGGLEKIPVITRCWRSYLRRRMHAELFREGTGKMFIPLVLCLSVLTSLPGLSMACVLFFPHFGFVFLGLGVEQGFVWGAFALSWCSKYCYPWKSISSLFPTLDGLASAAASSSRLVAPWHMVNCLVYQLLRFLSRGCRPSKIDTSFLLRSNSVQVSVIDI